MMLWLPKANHLTSSSRHEELWVRKRDKRDEKAEIIKIYVSLSWLKHAFRNFFIMWEVVDGI